ncbi:MAG: DUF945 family protein [Campylobacteraceae bacterium]
MKKILGLIVLVAVLLVGFYFYTINSASKKVDAFFTGDGGTLYDRSGLTWKLVEAKKGFFKSEYTTSVLIYNQFEVSVVHKASFGLQGFSLSRVGKMISTITLPEMEELDSLSSKNLTINSDITTSGFDTVLSSNDGSYDLDKRTKASWKGVNGNYFFTFGKDEIDAYLDIPYFEIDEKDRTKIVIENQKYTSKSSYKEIAFWLGDSTAKIDKITVTDLREAGNGASLSNLDMFSILKKGENDTIFSENRFSIKQVTFKDAYDAVDIKADNLVFNMDLENLDTESFKNIYDSTAGLDMNDQNQLLFTVMSWGSYVPKILGKKPKITFKDISGEYNGEKHSLNGFIEYVGNGKIAGFRDNSLMRDILSNIDITTSEKFVKTLLKNDVEKNLRWKYMYNDQISKEELNSEVEFAVQNTIDAFKNLYNIQIENGVIKVKFNLKDGVATVNDREITQILY